MARAPGCYEKAVDWQAMRTIFFVAFPFILAGVIFYVEISEKAVGVFLGGMLLITVPLRRVLQGRSIQVPRVGLAAIAVPYGFLSGASFGVGLMLGPFLLGAGVVGETLVATVAVNGFLLNVIKTVAFGISPLLTRDSMLIGVGLGPMHNSRTPCRSNDSATHTYPHTHAVPRGFHALGRDLFPNRGPVLTCGLFKPCVFACRIDYDRFALGVVSSSALKNLYHFDSEKFYRPSKYRRLQGIE